MMDLSTVTDIKELKSMAYDQIAAKEQAEANLRALTQRIFELQQTPEAKEKPTKKDD